MEHAREKWIPFTPDRSYVRRYVDYFFRKHGDLISGRVLDIGAGGNQFDRWTQITDSIDEYVSFDITRNETLHVQGDGATLPFQNGVFDTVLVSEVLEHVPVPDLPEFVAEIRRVLKSGGTSLASTPFVYPQHGSVDKSRLTRESAGELFESEGFDVIVHTGGGYTEVLLHVLSRPILGLLGKIDRRLGWPFVLVHYVLFLLAILAHRVAVTTAGRNPRADIWYLNTLTVARKPATDSES